MLNSYAILASNGLMLSDDKTEFVVIGTRQQHARSTSIELK